MVSKMLHHNQPPDMAVTADDTARDLSNWMAEHPIIETEDNARQAKLLADRAKLGIADLEAERKVKVDPLNQQVKDINEHYRPSRTQLQRVLDELQNRLTGFLRAEEERRIHAAQEAHQKAEEAERIAREAEERERSAYNEASEGVLGIDIAAVTEEADRKFKEFEKASHQAALAERGIKTKIGGGFTRALSLRNKETIIVDNPIEAIKEIGLGNEIIDEAIVRAARAYKKVFGKYPNGVRSVVERKV